MTAKVNTILKDCKNMVIPELKQKLHVSNPSVPGSSMRPVDSAVGSPTYKLTKWLTKEFENLPTAQSSLT